MRRASRRSETLSPCGSENEGHLHPRRWSVPATVIAPQPIAGLTRPHRPGSKGPTKSSSTWICSCVGGVRDRILYKRCRLWPVLRRTSIPSSRPTLGGVAGSQALLSGTAVPRVLHAREPGDETAVPARAFSAVALSGNLAAGHGS